MHFKVKYWNPIFCSKQWVLGSWWHYHHILLEHWKYILITLNFIPEIESSSSYQNLNTISRRQQHPPLQWSRVIEYHDNIVQNFYQNKLIKMVFIIQWKKEATPFFINILYIECINLQFSQMVVRPRTQVNLQMSFLSVPRETQENLYVLSPCTS